MTAFMTYDQAKAVRAKYELLHDHCADTLTQVSGKPGPMGLTPDHIKSTDTWKNAYMLERKAFAMMRDFNGFMVKNFKKEMAAERKAKRGR